MPQALLKLRVGLRGPRWRYEAHPLRSEAKHNICRLIYHSAHLTPLPTCLLRSHPPRIRIPVSVTTTECFSFSELKARIIQAILAALAKYPSYLIRGTDILGCVMRNYYVFTPVFFFTLFFSDFLTYFCGYYFWLMVDGMEFNILVANSGVTLSFQNYSIFCFINY